MIRACFRGMVDFSVQPRKRSRWWRKRANLAYDEIEREALLSYRRDVVHLESARRTINGLKDEVFQKSTDTLYRHFSLIYDELFPWTASMEPDAKSLVRQCRELWEQAWGSLDDPDTKAYLEQLNQRIREGG